MLACRHPVEKGCPMKTRLAVLLLCFTPSLAWAGCAAHEKQAMSCAEGTTYDSASGTCVPQASS